MRIKLIALGVMAAVSGAALASADVDSLEQRINELEKRLEVTQNKAEATSASAKLTSGFEFHGYARSGVVFNDDFNGAKGTGAYMTPAGRYGASVGRLGLEDDSYVEVKLIKKNTHDDGSWSRYKVMFADGVETKNTWTADESNLNMREIYAELGNLKSFKGAFKNASIWAGKRFDKNNFDVHFVDSDIVFVNGTGAGINDVQVSENWKASLAFYGRDFGSADAGNTDIENYIVHSNNYFGDNWQFMLNGMKANDHKKEEGGSDLAESGIHTLLAYHTSFEGGFAKFGALYGQGLGAEVKNVGSEGQLTKDAKAFRVFAYSVHQINNNWRIAPSLLAETSKDRFVIGDKANWASFNLRAANPITKNFEMVYETSYQWMDLDDGTESADGSFYKFTVAPTFKLDTGAGFFERPEIRFFASYINWSDDLNGFGNTSSDDYFANTNYTSGGQFLFGAQMETWF